MGTQPSLSAAFSVLKPAAEHKQGEFMADYAAEMRYSDPDARERLYLDAEKRQLFLVAA